MRKKNLQIVGWILLALVTIVAIPYAVSKVVPDSPVVWRSEKTIRGVSQIIIDTAPERPLTYKLHVPMATGITKVENIYVWSGGDANPVHHVHDVAPGDLMWAELQNNGEDRGYYRNRLILHLRRPS